MSLFYHIFSLCAPGLCGVAYEMLADQETCDIYLWRLNYLISQDFRYIKDIVTAYPPKIRERTMEDLLASMPRDRKFVLYGAGQVGKAVLLYVEQDERFWGFCCQIKEKQEKGYLDHPCLSPEELLRRKDLSVIIIAIRENTAKSSAVRESHGCVVVLDGRQPACVLRLALQSPSSLPFSALFPWIAIV